MAARVGDQVLDEPAPPASRPSERFQPSSEHLGRRELEPDSAVDRRLDPMGMRTGKGEIEDGAGRRHHSKPVHHQMVDGVEPPGGVHGERQQGRPPWPFDRELHGMRPGTIQPMQCCGGFEADPAPIAEAQQAAAQPAPVGVGGAAHGIDARSESEHPSVADQTPLCPRRDTVGPELFGGDEAVLIGCEVVEGSGELHTSTVGAETPGAAIHVCARFPVGRPTRTATQTGMVGAGGGRQMRRCAGGWPRISVITSRASALRSSVTKTRAIGSRLFMYKLRL